VLRLVSSQAKLVVIDAPHFYAAVILKDGKVTEAAPILRYTQGWGRRRLWEYIKRRGWVVAAVFDDPA